MLRHPAPVRSLVTGSAGFVGRHLVDALVARGDDVVSLDISARAPRPDVPHRVVDLTDAEAVAAAVRDADVVFHVASAVHTRQRGGEHVWAVNVHGTEHLIDACRKNGVSRLVYVSSASVVYEGRDICDGDERLPYAETRAAPYVGSKIAAERRVLSADGDGLRTVAIRPHVVFGPDDSRFLPAILSRAQAGRLKFAVGRQRKLSDFTYVDNLIDALLAADVRLAEGGNVADRIGGRAYFVTNGEPVPFWEFVTRMLAQLDIAPPRVYLPYGVAYTAAGVAERVQALRGRADDPESGFTRFAIRYMCTDHYFSIDAARNDLGYEPRVSLQEGIERTAAAAAR